MYTKKSSIPKANANVTVRKLIAERFPNIVFISFVLELKKILKAHGSVLDVGCGADSPIKYLGFEHSVGVDIFEKLIHKAKQNNTHDELHVYDVRKIDEMFPKKSFDCCAAIDIIEHLSQKEGLKLVNDLENISRNMVIIFTPNGFIEQKDAENPFHEHLSGWDVKQMKALGYAPLGMYGHKSLRSEWHNLRFRPKVFWGAVSIITNLLYTQRHPEKAAAVLYVKKILP